MEFEILPLGSKAIVANDIEVIIIGVTLYAHGGIMYNIAWWDDGSRKDVWIQPCELKADSEKTKIGFVR